MLQFRTTGDKEDPLSLQQRQLEPWPPAYMGVCWLPFRLPPLAIIIIIIISAGVEGCEKNNDSMDPRFDC